MDKLSLAMEYVMTAQMHDTAFKDNEGQPKFICQ